VRREIPDHIAVVLVAAEAQSCGVDVQDATEVTGTDDLLELPDGGVVLEGISHHQGQSAQIRCDHHLLGGLDRRRQWLLNHRVQPGPQRLQRDRGMTARRGGDHDGVQLIFDVAQM
jgi:hypothetical protein